MRHERRGKRRLDKRYQVFISSTFMDLRKERQAVSQALLRSDCFPAQMENWPAMDAEQMEAIKQIIDESDYFVVISAGKYGSISPKTGVSYTEMEYDYAVEVGKPIIRLLHRDPFAALPGGQIESDPEVRGKLEAFHAKMRVGSVCKFWENADQLESATAFSLIDIKKRSPATGWIKAEGRADTEAELEILKLKAVIQNLETEISTAEKTLGSSAPIVEAVFEKYGSELSWPSVNEFLIWLYQELDDRAYDQNEIIQLLVERNTNPYRGQVLADALIHDDIIGAEQQFGWWKFTAKGERELRKARLNSALATS